jgi:hypothetical protein
MEFRLPENLHHQLLAYDPALKALAKEKKAAEKPEGARKKAKYPIGNINDLIPANIVDPAAMQIAIDRLNLTIAPNKHHVFYTSLSRSVPDRKVKAIIYYWESVWVAAWFPNTDEDYLYGFSYAVSTTKAERKGLNRITFNRASMNLEVADMETKKYGRVDYHVHTATVTLDTVCSSSGKYHWDPFNVNEWCAKGKLMKRDCIKLFTKEMRARIPVWKDECVFARVDKKINNLDHLFGQSLNMFSYKIPEEADVSWVPTAANIGNKICKYLDIPVVIFAKPFVQKELQLACDAAIETFNDPTAIDSRSALKPIKRFIAYMEGIRWIHSLWPEAPIDYYQTYKTALSSIDFNSWGMANLINHHTKAKQWVQEHMPITSMFLILDKAVKEEMLRTTPISGLTIYALRDTFTMINNVLDADQPLEPPARWRLTEFHDHVQAEAWKIKNTKQDLPQDLFPTPIKITHQEHTWTFLQPMDTHQLSQWGQAVRNCVGTGGYAEDVKKRLQFIVLCMLDGKPKFTIQLKLNQGLMSVQQIAGIGNARLNDDEKSLYTETFRQALAIRSAVE